MIGYLSGKLISSKPTKALIDVNGVGYEVNIGINTYDVITKEEIVRLFIYTNVKEDAIELYGFKTENEKEFFKLLISVNGIGPKTGLAMLSTLKIEEIKNAISRGNILVLSSAPGVGKKTAERVVLELKGKMDSIETPVGGFAGNDIRTEAVLALGTLGYNPKIAEKIVQQVFETDPNTTIEQLIKTVLKNISKV